MEEDLCRACLIQYSVSDTEHKLISIFEKVKCKDDNSDLDDDIVVYDAFEKINVKVGKKDILPKFICQSCLKSLKDAYNFRQLCILSKNKYIKQLKHLKNVNTDETTSSNLDELENETLNAVENENFISDGSADAFKREADNEATTEEPIIIEYDNLINIKEEDAVVRNTESPSDEHSERSTTLLKATQDLEDYDQETDLSEEKDEDYDYDPLQSDSSCDSDSSTTTSIESDEISRPTSNRKVKEKLKTKMKNKLKLKSNQVKKDKRSVLNKTIPPSLRSQLPLNGIVSYSKHTFAEQGMITKCNNCCKYFFTSRVKVHEMSCRYVLNELGTDYLPVTDNNDKYTCFYCNHDFLEPAFVESHIVTKHNEIKPFACEFCEKAFTHYGLYRRHVNYHKTNPKYFNRKQYKERKPLKDVVTYSKDTYIKNGVVTKCGNCCKYFLTSRIKIHEISCRCYLRELGTEKLPVIDDKDKYLCFYCNENFNEIGLIQNHMSAKHFKNAPFLCEPCNKVFNHYASYFKHLYSHKINSKCVNRPLSEDPEQRKLLYGIVFFTADTFKEFGLITKCNNCCKYILTSRIKVHEISCRYMLNEIGVEHLPLIDNKNKYMCFYCKEEFEEMSAAESHISLNHDKEKPFKCEFCDRMFPHYPSHSRHVKCHKYNPKYLNSMQYKERKPLKNIVSYTDDTYKKHGLINKCNNCCKYFLTSRVRVHEISCRRYLRELGVEHLPIADDNNKFSCFYCNEEFPEIGLVENHISTKHLDNTPFSCEFCDKVFNHYGSYSKHLSSHKNNPKYCNKLLAGNARQQKPLKDVVTYSRDTFKEHGMITKCNNCCKYFLTSRIKVHENSCRYVLNELGAEHLPIIDEKNKYSCFYCNEEFEEMSEIESHILTKHDKTSPFSCNFCFQVFTHYASRNRHVSSHINNPKYIKSLQSENTRPRKPLSDIVTYSKDTFTEHGMITKCSNCCKYFLTSWLQLHELSCRSMLYELGVEHLPITDDVDKYICFYCCEDFEEISLIEDHIVTKHNKDNPFFCKICDKVFSHFTTHSKHLKSHNDKLSTIECKFCGKYFTARQLKNHMTVHDTTTKECEICGKTFMNTVRLKTHIRSHSNPYKCKYCDKIFGNPTHLQNHERIHTGEEPYACHICDKKYKIRNDLLVHIYKHPNAEFNCNFCKKGFTSNEDLAKHLRRHETHDYQCEYCGLLLPTLKLYQEHKFFHIDPEKVKVKPKVQQQARCVKPVKKYKCSFCRSEFRLPMALEKHLKMHDQNRPFPCDMCNKAYKLKRHLQLHIKKDHLNEVHFPCKYCNKVYKDSSARNHHMVVAHKVSGDLYNCNFCSKKFQSLNNLEKHVQTHSPNICSVCGKKYSTKQVLLYHIHEKHPEQEDSSNKKVKNESNVEIEVNH